MHLRRSVRLLLVVVPVLALLVAGLQAPASAATATISGRVTLTAGGPAPAGTKVLVRPSGGGTALATTTTDASTGSYSLRAPAGSVDVVVNAPDESGLGETVAGGIDASMNRTVDVQLAPSRTVAISGVVRDAQGSVMSAAYLSIGPGAAITDVHGRYTMAISPGSYEMSLRPNEGGLYNDFHIRASITITGDRTLDLVVPTRRVTYRVVDPSGNPMAGVTLRVPAGNYDVTQPYTLAPGVIGTFGHTNGSDLGATDSAGVLETRVLGADDPLPVYALAPADSSLADAEVALPTGSGDAAFEVTLRPAVTVSGTVRDAQGATMSGTTVMIGTQHTYTDSRGRYSLEVSPGPATLLLSQGITSVYGSFRVTAPITISGTTALDLTLPTRRVTYRIADPAGHPVVGAHVRVRSYSSNLAYTLAPGVTGNARYSREEDIGPSNASGLIEIRVLGSDVHAPATAIAPSPTSTVADTRFTVPAITADSTIDVTMRVGVDLSGVVRDAQGSVLPNTIVQMDTKYVSTDADGRYAMVVAPGSYDLNLLRDGSPAYPGFNIVAPLTVTTARTLDLTVPTRRVTYHLVDRSGRPVSGAEISTYASQAVGSTLAPGVTVTSGGDWGGYLGKTDQTGTVDTRILSSDVPLRIVVFPPASAGLPNLTFEGPTLDSDRTVVISFPASTVDQTPPPGPGGKAKLSLTNSVSPLEALPGDTVTYTLTATNGAGAGDATGTVVTDVLPTGVTFKDASEGCVNDKGTVRCELGTIAAGSSKAATIRATVDPIPMKADPNTAHQILEQKAETDLRVERGETRTATASCPSGYLATDGGIRLDAVDQGGDVAHTSVPASGPTADGTGWTATLRNDNPGAALAKVTVACLARTTVTGAHQHDLVTTTATAPAQPLAAGSTTLTVACPAGQTPFAPSYALSGGGVVTTSRETGSGWSFVVDSPAAGTGDFGVACLGARTTTAAGHFHALGIDHRAQSIAVPAGQTIETQLTCADEAKGIVASRRLDAGLVDRGTDPRAKIRSFRFTNPTDHTLSADLGLTCVDIRTSGEPVAQRITNAATVATAAPDATTADDTASSTFTAYGDGWAILPTTTATVGGSARSASIGLDVRCASDCVISARLVALGKVRGTSLRAGSILASGRTSLAAGGGRLTVRATGTAASALTSRKVVRAKVVITTGDGATTTKTITLRR